MKRNIITIDQGKCNGCGKCIPNCPEGAIRIIGGKAHLVSDLFCDGLGACLGRCPEGAISVEEREAGEYSEREVMKNIVRQGPAVIAAHLKHLREHAQDGLVAEAEAFLKENTIKAGEDNYKDNAPTGGCPGARVRIISKPEEDASGAATVPQPSQLQQWPVQLHLVSPQAPCFKGSEVMLCADCVAYSLGDFHAKWLKGKTLAVACPKLDDGKEEYVAKIASLIDDACINTLTVMRMEVPCCGGLMAIAREAAGRASRKIPIKEVVVGVEGDILNQQWA